MSTLWDDKHKFECEMEGTIVTGEVSRFGMDFSVEANIEGKIYTFGMRAVYVLPAKYVIPRLYHVVAKNGRQGTMELPWFTEQDSAEAPQAFERGINACVAWHQALMSVKNKLRK